MKILTVEEFMRFRTASVYGDIEIENRVRTEEETDSFIYETITETFTKNGVKWNVIIKTITGNHRKGVGYTARHSYYLNKIGMVQ